MNALDFFAFLRRKKEERQHKFYCLRKAMFNY